ncbi:hypothetical protein FQN53_007223 [Emmonsiellopsis sp. PD_33]|nr:hypothetical protein FQN53_007223 [Emmonsiellopsis sp. PD_33]
MADQTPQERLFCHGCQRISARQGQDSLQCPLCSSDFVEILENPLPQPLAPETTDRDYHDNRDDESPFLRSRGRSLSPPMNLWARHGVRPPRNEGYEFEESPDSGTTYRHYRSPDGRFSFTSTTYRPTGNPQNQRGGAPDLVDRFPDLVGLLEDFTAERAGYGMPSPRFPHRRSPLGMHNQDGADANLPFPWRLSPRDPNRPQANVNPIAHLRDIIGGPHLDAYGHPETIGDGIGAATLALILQAVETLGESQLRTSRGATINQLQLLQHKPLQKVFEDKLAKGRRSSFDGTADCGICMEKVEADCEVTMLPCEHWFHGSCIEPWLDAHDTCPHCRRVIGAMSPTGSSDNGPTTEQQPRASSPSRPSGSGSQTNPFVIPDSPPQPPLSSNADRNGPNQHSGVDNDVLESGRRSEGPERRSSREREREDSSTRGGWLWNLFSSGS